MMPKPNLAGVEGSILFESSAGHMSANKGESKIIKIAFAEPNCAAVSSVPKSVKSVALSANKVIDPPDCSNIDQKTVLITIRKNNALIFPRSSESHCVTKSQINQARKRAATIGSIRPTPLGLCKMTQTTKTDNRLYSTIARSTLSKPRAAGAGCFSTSGSFGSP